MGHDFSGQEQQVAQLADELSRLNSQFDAQLKAAGTNAEELKALDFNKLPPHLKTQVEAARAAAKQAGEERKAHAKVTVTPAKSAPARRGALHV